MYRSFTDRVLGGVCGGLAVSLPLSAWMLRVLFVGFAVASLGVGALLYVALWWLLPQESLINERVSNPFRVLLLLIIVIGMVGAWVGHIMGWLEGSGGQALLWPVVLVILSGVFLLQQVRG